MLYFTKSTHVRDNIILPLLIKNVFAGRRKWLRGLDLIRGP